MFAGPGKKTDLGLVRLQARTKYFNKEKSYNECNLELNAGCSIDMGRMQSLVILCIDLTPRVQIAWILLGVGEGIICNLVSVCIDLGAGYGICMRVESTIFPAYALLLLKT